MARLSVFKVDVSYMSETMTATTLRLILRR
ncbi:MAG: hypothetical protein ACJAWY_002280 [Sphingomonas echinoides]|jgi:hypothetical protein